MANLNIVATTQCSTGEHLKLRLTAPGGNNDFAFNIDDLRAVMTTEEQFQAAMFLVRYHCRGMTRQQTLNQLATPGIDVVTT